VRLIQSGPYAGKYTPVHIIGVVLHELIGSVMFDQFIRPVGRR
jgi:hypothetical protein